MPNLQLNLDAVRRLREAKVTARDGRDQFAPTDSANKTNQANWAFFKTLISSIVVRPRLQSMDGIADIHGQIDMPDLLIRLKIVQRDRRR